MDESYAVRIPFFFLGDLLDILFQILHDKIGGKTNEKAIRTLEQFSFLVGGIVLKHKGQDKDLLFNLADIPISYDLFKVWFTDNVIQPQLPSYKLTNLFRDIMNSLVVSALGDGCFGGGKNNPIPSFVPLSTQRAEGGKSRLKGDGSRCKMESILNAIPLSDEGSRSTAQTENILYFFAKEDQINYLDGKQITHEKRGIYHLRIGQSRGIIKDVNFSKTDFKFLRESRIVGTAQETAADGFLREKYDAEITMVGNSLFHPGQLIYIDPEMPGATRGQARKLGFSGYYFVLTSFHLAEDQYYQTTITAVHQGFAGAGGAKFPQAFPSTTKAACGPRNPSDPPPKSVSGGGEPREERTRADEKAAAQQKILDDSNERERADRKAAMTPDQWAREQNRRANMSPKALEAAGMYKRKNSHGVDEWVTDAEVPKEDVGAGQPLQQ
jgi:hypothetical protein